MLKRQRDNSQIGFALFLSEELNKQIENKESIEFKGDLEQHDVDYDTDSNMIRRAKMVLETDLFNSVDFFMKEDPLVLIENF